MIVRDLGTEECKAILARNRLARLACAQDGQPYVVPLFYAYADEAAYAFSLPGRKMDIMRTNPKVALLVEEAGDGKAWKSVVAEGRFEELPDRIGTKRERDHAWSLLSAHARWWEPGALKPGLPAAEDPRRRLFFRIRIDGVHGREGLAKQAPAGL